MQLTLIDFFDRGAALAPHGDCLVEDGLRLSYRDVQRWTHRIAHALRRSGVAAGDGVALLSPNSAWGYLTVLGLQRCGAVWVPLNARGSLAEWAAHLQRTRARWLFVHAELAQHGGALLAAAQLAGITVFGGGAAGAASLQGWLDELPVGPPDEPFVPPSGEPATPLFRITSSGGTTGAPKAIEQTQAGVAANVAAFLAIASHDAPRYLMCNPMTHAAGVIGIPILAMGGAIVFVRRPDPGSLPEVVARERITCLMVAPTSLHALLERPDLADLLDKGAFATLRYLMFGAAPTPRPLLQRALAAFGPVLMQLYAQTEASTLVTAMLPADYAAILAAPDDAALQARLTSVGRPTPFARVAVMDDDGRLLPAGQPGEIVVRSAMVMRGYRDDADGTAATRLHGWHHTGDIGIVDEAGYLHVVDRKRDLIISGGFNVFPSRVERLIAEHPAVRDCAVVGVADAHWGEAVKAVIELREGMAIDLAALEADCRRELGAIQCPKSFDIWPELPRSHLGKVLKRQIRDHYARA